MNEAAVAGTTGDDAKPCAAWTGARAALPSDAAARRATLLWALFIFAVALALRLLLLADENFWLDESVSLDQATRTDLVAVLEATAADNYPPLHNILIHFWHGLFGGGWFSLRLPSVICSLLALWFAGRLVARLYGQRAALFAMALLAASPVHIGYAQELRMYALFLFLALWSCDRFVRWLEAPSVGRLSACAAVNVLLCYSHYYAAFFLAGQSLTVLLLRWRARRAQVAGPPLGPWVLSQVAVLLLFLPWLPALLSRYGALQGAFWIPRPGLGAIHDVFQRTWSYAYPLALALIAIALWPRWLTLARLDKLLVRDPPPEQRAPLLDRTAANLVLLLPFALTFVLAFVLSFVVQPLFLHRYLVVAFTLGTLLVAAGSARLARPWLQVSLVVALLAAALPALVRYYRDDQKPRWLAAIREIQRDAGPADLIVCWPLWARISITANGDGPLPPMLTDSVDLSLAGRLRWVDAQSAQADNVWLVSPPNDRRDFEAARALLTRQRAVLSESRYPLLEVMRLGPRRP